MTISISTHQTTRVVAQNNAASLAEFKVGLKQEVQNLDAHLLLYQHLGHLPLQNPNTPTPGWTPDPQGPDCL